MKRVARWLLPPFCLLLVVGICRAVYKPNIMLSYRGQRTVEGFPIVIMMIPADLGVEVVEGPALVRGDVLHCSVRDDKMGQLLGRNMTVIKLICGNRTLEVRGLVWRSE